MVVHAMRHREVTALLSSEIEGSGRTAHLFFYLRFLSEK